jgi:hypothetical protein
VAVISGKAKTLQLLHEHGADVGAMSTFGHTSLLLAPAIITNMVGWALLNAEANPNSTDENGYSVFATIILIAKKKLTEV